MIEIPVLTILTFLLTYIIPTVLAIAMMYTVIVNRRCIESWVLFFIGAGILSYVLHTIGLLNIVWR